MIIRRFSLLWEDVLWQILNVYSDDLSPHFTTNVKWHFSCLKCSWRYFGLIAPYSTSMFITSEYSGIKVSACLWSPTSAHLASKAKPMHKFCTAPGAHWAPSAPSGEPSLSLSLSGEADTARDPHIHWQPAWAQVSWAGPAIWAEFMWGMDKQHPASPIFYMAKTILFPPYHCSADAEKPKWH